MERDFMGLNSKESFIVDDATGGCKDPVLFRCPQVQWSLTNTFNPSNKWQSDENQRNTNHNKEGGAVFSLTNYPIQQNVCQENLPPHDAKALVGVNQGISLSLNNSFFRTQSAGAGHNFTAASTEPQYLGGIPITALYPNPSFSSQTATNEQWFDLKTSGAPAQMTIFYGGTVNVFDDISPDKAEAIMVLAGKGSSASCDVAQPRHQVVAPSPKPVAENVFFGSQPVYTAPCSGLSSPISISSHPMWQSGSGPNNNDGANKISRGSTTPVNEASKAGTTMTQSVPNPVAESNADFEGSNRHTASSLFPRRSFQEPRNWRNDNDNYPIPHPRLDRRYSVCDRVIFGHRPSDYDSNVRWGHRPSDYSSSHRSSDYSSSHRPSDYSSHRPSDYSSQRPSDYSSSQRPSDYSLGHRPSDYSWGQRPSDYSRWGSSDDDYGPGNSPSTVLFSPMEDGYRMPGHSRYCLVVTEQMVGVFLTIWVRSDLKEHVQNIKVSRVGRGLMGYLGNKGSISVSMLLHQTSFCFVCSHLTSGQKEGDELRRNSDVMQILRRTRFPRVRGICDDKSPETILEHDRIIWVGDLNYRIALSYRSAKALVEMQNWRALLENDQLRIEQRRGRVFEGWREGKIYFPPTYKYSNNSDRYTGESINLKEKRRTPAWCDRILWFGRGLHQLSYVRGESRFSDHRPVYSIFWAEVESSPSRLKKSTSCSTSRIEVEELFPYSHGYTELCFF